MSCRQTASLSGAALDVPRPVTGIRRMPHRGPNNEAPARSQHRASDGSPRAMEPTLLLIGWDWASTSHAVTVLDAAGAILGCWRVGHTEHDLEMLLARLAASDDPAALPVAIERTEGPGGGPLLPPRHPAR